jgi:hypothetical protein
LLALYQEPIPEGMDGIVRTELFAEGTEMNERESEYDSIEWIKAKTGDSGQTGDAVHS